MKRDLLRLVDLTRDDCNAIFALATEIKTALRSGKPKHLLAGKTLAMIFEKPSLRTRVSFETGMFQLGGHAIYLAPWDIRLGERETVADVARNLARVVDMIVARTFRHAVLVERQHGEPRLVGGQQGGFDDTGDERLIHAVLGFWVSVSCRWRHRRHRIRWRMPAVHWCCSGPGTSGRSARAALPARSRAAVPWPVPAWPGK